MSLKLNSNQLKIIAALSMLVDHLGYMLFPEVKLLRILGRFSFPIFAYFIAEGCRYTKNKRKYLLRMLGVGMSFLLVWYLLFGEIYVNVMITFSFSIGLTYLVQWWKESVIEKKGWKKPIAIGCITAVCLAATYIITRFWEFEYGSLGILTPVYIAFFDWDTKHSKTARILGLALGLTTLGIRIGGNQWFMFLAIPLLLLYDGQRGKYNLKYFFYIFYPLHYLIVQGIAICLSA